MIGKGNGGSRRWADGEPASCRGRGRCDASSSRGHVGEGLQVWRVELGSTYAHAVRSELGAAIDRRLRRVWPSLKLVPASWIVLIVAPGARSLRRSLSRVAVAVAVSTCTLIVL